MFHASSRLLRGAASVAVAGSALVASSRGRSRAPARSEAAPAPRRLSPIGRMTRLADAHGTSTTIALALATSGPPLEAATLAAKLAPLVAAQPRLRSLVSAEATATVLPAAAAADIAASRTHARDWATAGGAHGLAEAALGTPFGTRFAAPLWDCHVGSPPGGDGSLAVVALHHSVGDGMSLASVLTGVLDEAADLDALAAAAVADYHAKRKAKRAARKPLTTREGFLVALRRLALALAKALGGAVALAASLTKMARVAAAPMPWRRHADASRVSVGWGVLFDSVAEARALAKAVDPKATLNDLFVALVGGALRRRLLAAGRELPAGYELGCTVPVNVRGGVVLQGEALANHIGAINLLLPVGEADPAARLRKTQARLSRWKLAGEHLVSHVLAKLCGALLPDPLASRALAAGAKGVTVAVSNVRGPPGAVHIDGRKVELAVPLITPPPGVPLGAIFVTQEDRVVVGATVVGDVGIGADAFVQLLREEKAALGLVAAGEKKATEPARRALVRGG